MRIGLITEGRPDQAVIENILEGQLGDLDYDTIPIRPILLKDETDIHLINEAALGGLSRVKADCEEKTLFDKFFHAISKEEDFIILQVDTAEIELYGVNRPRKKSNPEYVQVLRENTIQKIKEWLGTDFDEKMVFAITIEEMEAWLLTIFEKKDSTSSMTPKEKLKKLLRRKNISTKEEFNNYDKLSKPFSKTKKLTHFQTYNTSLRYFLEDLEGMVAS